METSWGPVGRLAVFLALIGGVACGASAGPGFPGYGSGSGTGSPDAGPPDAGNPDAGSPDSGSPDAGGLKRIGFPKPAGWTFFGPQNGGPQDVRDVAMDEGGNLWVAAGSEGLFLMRADASGNLSGTFEKFGIADGLHPYGWLNGEAAQGMGVPDGSPADPHPSLDATPVIAVNGGPAGTVFVGYQGKPGCESAWLGDQWTPPSQWGDPAVYKSGDADRVTLTGGGISVVHYDIFSGPGVIGPEPKGREKLCSVYRIAWDKAKNTVWFGGNHGFAVGRADAPNTPTCNGEYPGSTNPGNCAVVWEHSHPAISGCSNTGPGCKAIWMTDAYHGVAIDPTTHDGWLGGANRSTKFHLFSYGGDLSAFYKAQLDTEAPANATCQSSLPCGMKNRWDLWPDQVPEWDPVHGVNYVTPLQRSTPGVSNPDYALDDSVSGIVALDDGTAWVASFSHGLVRIDSWGSRLSDATANLASRFVSGIARDPGDGSIWAAMAWGPGLSRITPSGSNLAAYGKDTFGDVLMFAPVASVQAAGSGSARSILVGFRASAGYAGAIAIYKGK